MLIIVRLWLNHWYSLLVIGLALNNHWLIVTTATIAQRGASAPLRLSSALVLPASPLSRPAPRIAVAHHAAQLSAAGPDSPGALLSAAEDYIQHYHVPGVSWHMSLNNHASTRPKAHGGKLVHSTTACNKFEQSPGNAPGSTSASWRCSLDLPNSFAPGDGRVLHAVGERGN